jgi:hypothetical protein
MEMKNKKNSFSLSTIWISHYKATVYISVLCINKNTVVPLIQFQLFKVNYSLKILNRKFPK